MLHARSIQQANAGGLGGAEARHYVDSATLAYAARHLPDESPFTNAYAPMYMWHLPGHRVVNFTLSEFEKTLSNEAGSGYLAWAEGEATDYHTADLLLLPGLEVVRELPDGFIFRYRRPDSGAILPPTSAWYDGLVSGGPAAGAGGFGLYLTEHRLVYIKEPCRAADLAGEFYLHIFPMDSADLPEWRQGFRLRCAGFRVR